MSSLVLDLGHPSSNGYLQGRKQAKGSAMGKDRECSCLRLQRIIISRRVGTLLAAFISALSLLMLLNVTSRFSSPSSKPVTGDDPPLDMIFNEQRQNFSMEDTQIFLSRSSPPLERMESIQRHDSIGDSHVSLSSNPPPPHERLERIQRHANFSMERIDTYQRMPWPLISSDHPLPSGHPCQGFTLPPPPADKKRTGPRPCPVCYLPVEKAIDAMPVFNALQSSAIKQLSYVKELPMFPQGEKLLGIEFGGHPTLEDRWKSYQIQENMKIHCGFAQGVKPGAGSGFDIEEVDRMEMDRCTGIVVASAIFGNYDQLQQPENVSEESMNNVCFFMFIDEETQRHLNTSEIMNGVWRLVVVHNLPYSDARRNGKIPKLLLHRLFPNARFSLWIDGKLKLVVDPYQVLERFLWRRNLSFAISRHYKRFDVFEEAEANKAAGKYNNASINAQVDFYRSEGLVPYDRTKSFFPSDVPEGCVIMREHTPVTDLFTCLWFNEVDRFTSRDQLSFAVVRDMLMERIPFRLSMFLDCERRNFVVQEYHRDLLEQKKAAVNTATRLPSIELSKPHGDLGVNVTPPSAFWTSSIGAVNTASIDLSKPHGHRGVNVPPPSASRTSLIRTTSRSHGRHRRGGSSRRRMGSRLDVKNA